MTARAAARPAGRPPMTCAAALRLLAIVALASCCAWSIFHHQRLASGGRGVGRPAPSHERSGRGLQQAAGGPLPSLREPQPSAEGAGNGNLGASSSEADASGAVAAGLPVACTCATFPGLPDQQHPWWSPSELLLQQRSKPLQWPTAPSSSPPPPAGLDPSCLLLRPPWPGITNAQVLPCDVSDPHQPACSLSPLTGGPMRYIPGQVLAVEYSGLGPGPADADAAGADSLTAPAPAPFSRIVLSTERLAYAIAPRPGQVQQVFVATGFCYSYDGLAACLKEAQGHAPLHRSCKDCFGLSVVEDLGVLAEGGGGGYDGYSTRIGDASFWKSQLRDGTSSVLYFVASMSSDDILLSYARVARVVLATNASSAVAAPPPAPPSSTASPAPASTPLAPGSGGDRQAPPGADPGSSDGQRAPPPPPAAPGQGPASSSGAATTGRLPRVLLLLLVTMVTAALLLLVSPGACGGSHAAPAAVHG